MLASLATFQTEEVPLTIGSKEAEEALIMPGWS